VRTEGTIRSDHARFEEWIRIVLLVASDLSVGTIQEASVTLWRCTRAFVEGATAPLSETTCPKRQKHDPGFACVVPVGRGRCQCRES
jgi:hypothetical protein